MSAASTVNTACAIEGEMTIYRAAELRTSLQAALADHLQAAGRDGDGEFALDLSAVTEMDSAGAQLLIAAGKSARAAQRALRLVDPSPAVAEALEALGLAHHPLWQRTA